MKLHSFRAVIFFAVGAVALAPRPGFARTSESVRDLVRQLNEAFIDVAEEVSPSVVVISVAQKPSLLTMTEEGMEDWMERLPEEFKKQIEKFFPHPPPDRRRAPESESDEPRFDGQGSGVILRDDGYILTNNHVVKNAEKIRVRLKDGREFEAELRGTDNKSDLAIVKLKGEVTGLKPARFADSDKVRVGEFAIAIGAPFELDYSVTFGHVSAKSRSDVIPTFMPEGRSMDQDFIQTDASINPGNSGGPLVNIEGEVIGINSMIRGLRSGIGFAIPSNMARRIGSSIIENGRYARSWLGIGIRSLHDNVIYRDMVPGVKDGVVVESFVAGGPASRSELKLGDVITAVDEKPVRSPQELRNEIRDKAPNSTVALNVHRRGKDIVVKVKPELWPDEEPVAGIKKSPGPSTGDEGGGGDLGLQVKTVTPETSEEFNLGKDLKGVVVTEVEKNGVAAKAGLSPGDVISEVNTEPVTNVKDFNAMIRKARIKEGVMLSVVSARDGVARFFVLRDRAKRAQ